MSGEETRRLNALFLLAERSGDRFILSYEPEAPANKWCASWYSKAPGTETSLVRKSDSPGRAVEYLYNTLGRLGRIEARS